MTRLRTVRGTLLCPSRERGRFELIRDGVLELDAAGTIRSIGSAPTGCTVATTRPGCVWLPGFVDTHVHFPQTRAIGRSSGALLDWLQQTIFAEEAKFADPHYAAIVAREFCQAMIDQGTTCASIYGSSHHAATEVLFRELDRSGLRAQAGTTLMDRGAPAELCVAASDALPACDELAARWDGHDGGRLRYCVTPRFALSCSAELMNGAAELAQRRGLPIQTHLAEHPDEVAAVARAFPESATYLETYAAHGLCTERTLFGHALWLAPEEWRLLAEQNAAISHCPDSNFFLGSGVFRLREATERRIRVGLGSDVGAGRTFSMRRVASAAYDASLLNGVKVSSAELLWLATTGGAEALGLTARVGRLESGFDADLVAIECGVADRAGSTLDELLDALVFCAEGNPVRGTYVRGRQLARTEAVSP